jgi:cyclopropane fatty-acyl-phospholipid synthase-like methyltransferase
MQRVFQIMDLQPTDIFIDLGHGIGNASLQAAYTRGCEARGIEIMQDRCFIADRFKERLAEIKHLLHEERDGDVSYNHIRHLCTKTACFNLVCIVAQISRAS